MFQLKHTVAHFEGGKHVFELGTLNDPQHFYLIWQGLWSKVGLH